MECNDDDHGGTRLREHFGERSNDPDPIEPGHHQIDHERIDVLSFEQFEGFDAIACEQNIEIGKEQEITRGATDFRVIVDNEDGAPARVLAGNIPLLVVHSRGYEAAGNERKGELGIGSTGRTETLSRQRAPSVHKLRMRSRAAIARFKLGLLWRATSGRQ